MRDYIVFNLSCCHIVCVLFILLQTCFAVDKHGLLCYLEEPHSATLPENQTDSPDRLKETDECEVR